MFPYPSGQGLHIGHYYNYSIIDSYCRWLRYNGEEVLQPFGYDAFGLPAENYALRVGRDPREVTYENIDNFRRQMVRMNTQYDERLITSDPSYYKWTQWLFLQLHNKGLAYKKNAPVNYDPVDKTVLANEQVINGYAERSGAKVEIRDMEQWFFKITDYRERLIAGLDNLDYPESTIKQQRMWLENLHDWCVSRQRKWGCPIPLEGETDTLDTFVDSSFYYLRYLTNSEDEFLPAGSYQPVDLYVGGPEHACMHLIYARFIHYFLYDIGIVPQEEPFNRVYHQGLITKDGAKMAKSTGNVVNPDDFDPDELRLALMFIGPYNEGGDWTGSAIKGIHRFVSRLRLSLQKASPDGESISLDSLKEKVGGYVKSFKFNKVVSTIMEFYNKQVKNVVISKDTAQDFTTFLNLFAPSFTV